VKRGDDIFHVDNFNKQSAAMPKFDDFSQNNGYVRLFICSEFRHLDAVPFAVNARAIGPTCP
jgi:hypothetical protein